MSWMNSHELINTFGAVLSQLVAKNHHSLQITGRQACRAKAVGTSFVLLGSLVMRELQQVQFSMAFV